MGWEKRYKRGDKLMWSAGTKYVISCTKDKRQFYVLGGFSGIIKNEKDVDRSEDTSLVGFQEKGRIHDSDGSFSFFDIGMGYDITRYMSVGASLKLPLSKTDSKSENAFDRQLGFSLTFKF